MRVRIVLLVAALASGPLSATERAIYRCTDASGAPTFTDLPCPGSGWPSRRPRSSTRRTSRRRSACNSSRSIAQCRAALRPQRRRCATAPIAPRDAVRMRGCVSTRCARRNGAATRRRKPPRSMHVSATLARGSNVHATARCHWMPLTDARTRIDSGANSRDSAMATHEVTNQVPPLADINLFRIDRTLAEAVTHFDGGWGSAALDAYGALAGGELLEQGRLANRYAPELRTHDAYGHRIDEVAFHPAYHRLMKVAIAHGVHGFAWEAGGPGRHVVRAGLELLHNQADSGTDCPLTMTYASIPALRTEPGLAQWWEPRIVSREYDGSSRPYFAKARSDDRNGDDRKAGWNRRSCEHQPRPAPQRIGWRRRVLRARRDTSGSARHR